MVIVHEIDVRPLERYFSRYTGRELAARVALALEDTAAKIAHDAKRDVKRDTGALAASITYDVWGTTATSPWGTTEGDMWGRVYSGKSYAAAVEFGRAPGGPMPPEGELLRWMARKGIPESAEYAIRRKIAVQGIEPAPYLRPALTANQEYFHERLRFYIFVDQTVKSALSAFGV